MFAGAVWATVRGMSYATLCQNIAQLAASAQRSAPQLVVVSKTQPAAAIAALIAQGAQHFAENRLAEAQEKWPTLRAQHSATQLHYIGALQSNKVKAIAALFDVIHTLDTHSAAQALAALPQPPQFYVQVNLAGETQKRGIAPAVLGDFLQQIAALGLQPCGLMTLPPVGESTVYFKQLAQLAQQYALPQLSMGMSDDYPAAIACGSTCVRIGRAAFA